MEHYGLRKSGDDIDFVIAPGDYEQLSTMYPDHLKDLFGDLGVCVHEFELWTSICLFPYWHLAQGAIEQTDYKIVSLEKLLFLKSLALHDEKCKRDLELIVGLILDLQYGKKTLA